MRYLVLAPFLMLCVATASLGADDFEVGTGVWWDVYHTGSVRGEVDYFYADGNWGNLMKCPVLQKNRFALFLSFRGDGIDEENWIAPYIPHNAIIASAFVVFDAVNCTRGRVINDEGLAIGDVRCESKDEYQSLSRCHMDFAREEVFATRSGDEYRGNLDITLVKEFKNGMLSSLHGNVSAQSVFGDETGTNWHSEDFPDYLDEFY